MISAISSVTEKAVLNKNFQTPSFKRNDDVLRNDLDDLSLIPDYRDLVVKKANEGAGVLGFVESVNKEISMSQAQLKVDMLQEKLDNLEEGGMKKDILSWMLADAVDEMEKLKLHYNEV
ncbi:hypothetical protein IJI31_03365 [bacterium]|nr:hypothetical protein [bacterium]